MTQMAVTVKPGLVSLAVMISVQQKQALTDIAIEDQKTLRQVAFEAFDDYIAKKRGLITERQARKNELIQMLHREERERQAREREQREYETKFARREDEP